MIPLVLYGLTKIAFPNGPNPFEPMIFISYEVADSPQEDPRYAKGPRDLAFLAYHIIVFSFIRQFTLFNLIHPIALSLGIKRGSKLERFGEQAYAVLYYGTMGAWGIVSGVNIILSMLMTISEFSANHEGISYMVVSDTILLDRFARKNLSLIWFLIQTCRLSSLGYESWFEALLFNALVILVAAAHHHRA